MDLIEELLGLVDALRAERIEYAVCGGIAVAIHGHPRFTKDLDLLVQRADVERIRAAAKRCGFTLEGLPLVFASGSVNEREILRLTKAVGPETLTLDLLLVGPPLAGVWAARKPATWRGRELWVVSREGLLQMKRLSGRPQDLADIQALTRPEAGERDG
jgi:hypothetical protein